MNMTLDAQKCFIGLPANAPSAPPGLHDESVGVLLVRYTTNNAVHSAPVLVLASSPALEPTKSPSPPAGRRSKAVCVLFPPIPFGCSTCPRAIIPREWIASAAVTLAKFAHALLTDNIYYGWRLLMQCPELFCVSSFCHRAYSRNSAWKPQAQQTRVSWELRGTNGIPHKCVVLDVRVACT
ncbi:uncharacterized protein I206_106104 [Kwoniella pini CBS 10737]|uniref:Uncharacterized protein n=1 Tax=Kwoniella pini CBS 10737 TaxID=1296096 RepID=A0A1B9I125_9TREE|nr:uncharacterized protein I206_04927 [Kwoniella pini CBS 10737]OCF49239.1 hypothetical protein I206_04927 [Kwoniella pini CBS 10737]